MLQLCFQDDYDSTDLENTDGASNDADCRVNEVDISEELAQVREHIFTITSHPQRELWTKIIVTHTHRL